MNKEEKDFLDKLKVRLEISDEECNEILKNPINPSCFVCVSVGTFV
ncbi:hypothetical protein Pf1_01833 [Flavobacterium columnare]|nr:hypothetical protein Pf1_01833 [Flavobacterium columnare]